MNIFDENPSEFCRKWDEALERSFENTMEVSWDRVMAKIIENNLRIDTAPHPPVFMSVIERAVEEAEPYMVDRLVEEAHRAAHGRTWLTEAIEDYPEAMIVHYNHAANPHRRYITPDGIHVTATNNPHGDPRLHIILNGWSS